MAAKTRTVAADIFPSILEALEVVCTPHAGEELIWRLCTGARVMSLYPEHRCTAFPKGVDGGKGEFVTATTP